MCKVFVERSDPHCAHSLADQIANGIINHCRHHAGSQAKAISQICGDVKLASAYMDSALRCLAERNNPRIQSMDQGAERYKVKGAFRGNVKTICHSTPLVVINPGSSASFPVP